MLLKGGTEYYSGLAADHLHRAAVLSSAEHASPEGIERDENAALGRQHFGNAYKSANKELAVLANEKSAMPVRFGRDGPPTSAGYGCHYEGHCQLSILQLNKAKQLRDRSHSALEDPTNHVYPKASKTIGDAANNLARAAHLEAMGNQNANEAKRYFGLKQNMEKIERARANTERVRVVCMACVSSHLMIHKGPSEKTSRESVAHADKILEHLNEAHKHLRDKAQNPGQNDADFNNHMNSAKNSIANFTEKHESIWPEDGE
jgi:hypothetical protein